MNATSEQIARAEKVIAMGCKLPFEKVLEMEIKKDAKLEKKFSSKKNSSKWGERARVDAKVATMSIVDAQNINEEALESQKRVIR